MLRKLKAGRPFELLVRDVERALGRHGVAKVESPLRLRDKSNGTLREFDVGITLQHSHERIVWAFECRDRSRKVSVPDVEGFVLKCKDTGVHRGVIVSARGFWSTAIRKANRWDVGCLTLAEARSFDWLLATTFGSHECKITEAQFLLSTGDAALDSTISDATPYDAAGRAVSQEERMTAQSGLAAQIKTPSTAHEGRMELEWLDCPWFLKDRMGALHAVRKAVLHIAYRSTFRPVGLNLHFYRDDVTGKLIKEVASVEVCGDGLRRGRLLLIHDESGTRVTFVPDPSAGIFGFGLEMK